MMNFRGYLRDAIVALNQAETAGALDGIELNQAEAIKVSIDLARRLLIDAGNPKPNAQRVIDVYKKVSKL